MATERRNKSRESRAMRLLDEIVGEPLTFGSLIRTIRQCDEVRQAEFAARLGVSKQHLSNIENGLKSVSPERAARWAAELGYLPQQFVQLAVQDQLERAGLDLRVRIEAA